MSPWSWVMFGLLVIGLPVYLSKIANAGQGHQRVGVAIAFMVQIVVLMLALFDASARGWLL